MHSRRIACAARACFSSSSKSSLDLVDGRVESFCSITPWLRTISEHKILAEKRFSVAFKDPMQLHWLKGHSMRPGKDLQPRTKPEKRSNASRGHCVVTFER